MLDICIYVRVFLPKIRLLKASGGEHTRLCRPIMDNIRVHMMDYPGSDACSCCIEKRVAAGITSKHERMTAALNKMMSCTDEDCKCCSETRTLAKNPILTNSQMSMCVKVFMSHKYKVNVNEIDSSVILFLYLNQASNIDYVAAVYKHVALLENFVDYQSAYLLKRLKECVVDHLLNKTAIRPLKSSFFRQLLVHLGVSKYSSWKRLKFIFEQIFDIGINLIDIDEFTKDMLNHFPRNVKTSYIHLAAICGYKYSYYCLQRYYGTFVKVLRNGLKHQETASVSKDLFLALAQQAETYNYNPIKKWFFTFCKNTFGSPIQVIRQRATHYWLPDFARTYPKLLGQLCKSIKINFKNNELPSEKPVDYNSQNSWLALEKYAYLMCTMGLHSNEFVEEMKQNIVLFVCSRKEDLSVAAAEYYAKKFDEKAYQYTVAELYLIYSKLTAGFSNLGRHCKERFRRTKLLTFIKNATENWIKPSINVYIPRREIAYETLLVLYLQDHDARDYVEFFWENVGVEKRIKIMKLVEEKCGGLSMNRWEELLNLVDNELDYYRLYTELRTLRSTNPYKFYRNSESEISKLINSVNNILKDVGSSSVGSTAKVPIIRGKFIQEAWANNKNLSHLQIEQVATMMMKDVFYGHLFVLMYRLIDRNFSAPDTFRAVIKAVYSIILRVEDKKVTDVGIDILRHACVRAIGFEHYNDSLHRVFSNFFLEFKLFLVDPHLNVRAYGLFNVLHFFLQQLLHLPLLDNVMIFLIGTWTSDKYYVEEVSKTFFRNKTCVIRCCKILNFLMRTSSYDLSNYQCQISLEVCKRFDESSLTSFISRLAASMFQRMFPQDPILLPLYEFLKSHPSHPSLFDIFLSCFKKDPENEIALIFFSHFTLVHQDHYRSHMKSALNEIKSACCKLYSSKRFTARSTGLQICYNFFGKQDEWYHKYQKTYKSQSFYETELPLKGLTINSKEEALDVMIAALKSHEPEKVRNAAFFKVNGKISEKENQKDYVIARICNLLLFGNHENPEIRFLASCASDCSSSGAKPISATAYLINLLSELRKNGTSKEIIQEVKNLLKPRQAELTAANPAFDDVFLGFTLFMEEQIHTASSSAVKN
uniref:Uncharacterized protein n=1 Tax=Panagrolaimus superbus TaxID=310955 RepID=A0A914YMK5_9BILA